MSVFADVEPAPQNAWAKGRPQIDDATKSNAKAADQRTNSREASKDKVRVEHGFITIENKCLFLEPLVDR